MSRKIEYYNFDVKQNGLVTNKNVTIGGSANFDMSGSTGTFKTPTGATTLGGSLTIAAGKNLTMAAGAGAVDFSAASGSFKFPTGAVSGLTQNVINVTTATVTLTAAQSGSIVTFNKADGAVVTLPAPVVGLNYYFVVGTTITSNNAEIDTDAGTTFLAGSVVLGTDNTASKSFLGNGTSHVKVQMNGTTKGGIVGSAIEVVCISATQWSVNGNLAASGTLVTPFA